MKEYNFKINSGPLEFKEAIDYFKNKIPVTSEEFSKISTEWKTRAFTVSGYTSLEVLRKFMGELEKALKNGTTVKEFRNQMNDFLNGKGYEGVTPFQADNIFRTNIQTAYSVGHYKKMTDPAVKRSRPYWMYDAVNDRQTRPTHAAMDGKVYPADHEIWDTWYPPNGYRCRCGVRSLSGRQVKALGYEIETEIPKMVEPKIYNPVTKEWTKGMARPLIPDPGFSTNPAKVAWEPDLSKYPKILREIYRKRQKGM